MTLTPDLQQATELLGRSGLAQQINALRSAGQISNLTARMEPERPPLVIWEAYRRPCFICEKTGECAHREPQVELAYAAAMHAAIGRVVETKVKGAAA